MAVFLILLFTSPILALNSPDQFGSHGPNRILPEISGFPPAKSFFFRYVFPSKPVVVRGGASQSPAYSLWKRDRYFLSHQLAHIWSVTVEVGKKEVRDGGSRRVTLPTFLESYQGSDDYLVADVPMFLSPDLTLPASLGCGDVCGETLQYVTMWFSGGGTKSVVHLDEADNILCVYDGTKELILIDPHDDDIDGIINVEEGSYSTLDVDDVDLTKFPMLRGREYLVANLSAGDCLFIPYRWIHQVRSYGRNVAANIWFNHESNQVINFNTCHHQDLTTVDMCPVHGPGVTSLNLRTLENLQTLSRKYFTSANEVIECVSPSEVDYLTDEISETLESLVDRFLSVVDRDGDKRLTDLEWERLDRFEWQELYDIIRIIQGVLRQINDAKQMSAYSVDEFVDE